MERTNEVGLYLKKVEFGVITQLSKECREQCVSNYTDGEIIVKL